MKSNLYKSVLTLLVLIAFSCSVFFFISTDELRNIITSAYVSKILNLTVFYIFLITLLRNLDYILHKEFKKENFFDNDIAASIYYSIRFLAVAISTSLILM